MARPAGRRLLPAVVLCILATTACRATFERADAALGGSTAAAPAGPTAAASGSGPAFRLDAGPSPLAGMRALPAPTLPAPSGTPRAAEPDPPVEPTDPVAPASDPAADGRPVVDATGWSGPVVLDRADTVYDFGFSAPGDVIIAASNVEARNISGPGLRRIDASTGDITDSGFRDAEFTFAHIRMRGGTRVIRPYFIGLTDVNPQPHVSDGDIIQIFAYEGDIVAPLLERVVVYGKRRPPGSDAHNDGVQFTGIRGGRVLDPVIRDSTILGASSSAVQAKEVYGTFTIEGSTLAERFESYHAVIAKPGAPGTLFVWRDDVLLDGSSVAATGGWRPGPGSDPPGGNVTIS